jgi:mRNA (guanine-N7-)-methyltransferase
VGVVQRLDSPIIGLKNFNNWVKSVLITRFAHPVLGKSTHPTSGRGAKSSGGKVLEIGIGKGGDLTKWAKARIEELVGAGRLDAIFPSFCFLMLSQT